MKSGNNSTQWHVTTLEWVLATYEFSDVYGWVPLFRQYCISCATTFYSRRTYTKFQFTNITVCSIFPVHLYIQKRGNQTASLLVMLTVELTGCLIPIVLYIQVYGENGTHYNVGKLKFCVSFMVCGQGRRYVTRLCNWLAVRCLSLIHIWRCRRSTLCRSRWSPYH